MSYDDLKRTITMIIASASSENGAWLTLIKTVPVDGLRGCWSASHVKDSKTGGGGRFAPH